ncbi:MAG TPA: GNAT family N-acetyltransferase [bacterium]|nr:GNAT family N-acetyltransferase [bacterium]
MQQQTALRLEYVAPDDRKFREWLRKYREEVTGEAPPDEWLDAYIRYIFAEQGRSRHIWWAMDGQRPVGFAVAIITPQSPSTPRVQGTIAEFFIYPEYRREGFGRRMAEAVLEFLKSRGAHDIHASVTRGNVRGMRFWEACSFEISRYVLVYRPGLKREEDEDEDEF